MPDVNIERLSEYVEDDASQLGQLMPFLSEKFDGEPLNRQLLTSIISSPYHEQLVARIEGRIVGAATLSIIMGAAAGRKGYLEDFVTNYEVQGQGIGDKVWGEMMTWCKEQGVDLDFTSHPSRQAAHSFYRSHGASERETTVFHVDVE